MPLLITFQGKPVKRRRTLESGKLLLIMYAPQRGQAGLQYEVTQDEWQQHGREEFYATDQLPDVRALAV